MITSVFGFGRREKFQPGMMEQVVKGEKEGQLSSHSSYEMPR